MGSHADSMEPKVTDPLPTPVTAVGRDGLGQVLARPGRAVVALDFDGTLAPIVADPEQARAHPEAVAALVGLAPKVAGVAVVTGRPAEVAVRHGGFAGVAGLEQLVVLGHYGAERWDARTGTVSAPAPHPGVAAVRAELPGVLDAAGVGQGAWIEEKGRAVAVHTRRAADPQAAFEALRGPLTELATRHGLIVEPGRLVLELRPPGMDKGVALAEYVRERGAGSVLYAGDDLGDLPAFAAVDRLRSDGVPGLLVCSGSDEVTELRERADLVVDGPEAVSYTH
ncbi:trehalose-phosphatase, partial [Streptomyces resistomycificus]|uniref:trehalose-phosphatase n=1 Tax=Streptomyces resistomycificus TaxID=67356 RepID=UPI0007C59BE9